MAEGYGPIANQRVQGYKKAKLSSGKEVYLPAGSFIKCIHKTYLPAATITAFGDYNEKLYVAAFTQYGMALIDCTDIDWNVY